MRQKLKSSIIRSQTISTLHRRRTALLDEEAAVVRTAGVEADTWRVRSRRKAIERIGGRVRGLDVNVASFVHGHGINFLTRARSLRRQRQRVGRVGDRRRRIEHLDRRNIGLGVALNGDVKIARAVHRKRIRKAGTTEDLRKEELTARRDAAGRSAGGDHVDREYPQETVA